MTNWFNHTPARKRTNQYHQLNLKGLKRYSSYPIDTTFTLQWQQRGKQSLEVTAKRLESGLFIFTDTESQYGYHINFEQTQVTYGTRLWYQCPACKRRCAVLYHSHLFACRHCVKPAYESQNGYRQNYIGNRLRAARKRLWGGHEWINYFDLLESCYWWPKPKYIHRSRFERERQKILKLEAQYKEQIPAEYLNYFLRH